MTIMTCYGPVDESVFEALSRVRLAIFDVDGTITDGGIYLDATNQEFKRFFSKDGLGMSMLLRSGVEVAIITGRNSPLLTRRMHELKVTRVIQGQSDKEKACRSLQHELGLNPEQCAVIGDDLNDLPLFAQCRCTACPHDGYFYMRKIAMIKLTQDAGRGAAREFCDLIMMAQGSINPDGGPLGKVTSPQ